VETFFSEDAKQYIAEWKPLKEALGHRPFNPDSEEHKSFMEKTNHKIDEFKKKWNIQ
jgi:hypothetical protein